VADDGLVARIDRYPGGGVLSHLDADGYPASVRCPARPVPGTRDVALEPPAFAVAWRGAATLLFHRHDERLEGLAQLVLRGTIEERGDDGIVLAVADVITANGRDDTDEMPHAGAPLHMLAFFRVGRGKAKAYLAKRVAPWPPIPYDEIARAVAADDGDV
jgi:hypothetical protein